MDLPHRYTYNPRWTGIVSCAALFGAASAFMAYQASHINLSALFSSFIPLSATGAKVYYWVIVGLSTMFAVFAFHLLAVLFHHLANRPTLELAEDALLLPHGFLHRQTRRIPYADIKLVREKVIAKRNVLYIATAEREFEISTFWLDIESYQAVRDFMYSHVPVVELHHVKHEPPIRMTREEFISKQTAAERQIRRQVIPFGILYAIDLCMVLAIISLMVLLCILPLTDYPLTARQFLTELGHEESTASRKAVRGPN